MMLMTSSSIAQNEYVFVTAKPGEPKLAQILFLIQFSWPHIRRPSIFDYNRPI